MKRVIFAIAVLVVVGSSRADVKPASIFGNHMVVQQGMSIPVWGWSDPGERVTVTLGHQAQTAISDNDGKWRVNIPAINTAGQIEMTIAGKNTIRFTDVLVGEVWLGSGQSNMEFTVSKDLAKYPNQAKRFSGVINEEQEIAAADHPNVRMFTVKMKTSKDVLPDVEGQWEVCSPKTVPGFSAIGYFFSRDLSRAINRPVGFINTSYGASCAQAWISKDVLEADAKFKPVLDSFDSAMTQYQQALVARGNAPATQGAGRGGGRGGPRDPATDQHQPFVLYNAMLKGVQPYAIKGVLWYQGESITTGGTAMYTELMNTLITSWRQQWGQNEFPFYFVQLAAQDANSNRPEVREAQALSLAMPNTAMAVTIDIGEKTDVHPHNKQDLGARLARMALARDYGWRIEWSGPMYDSMKIEGNSIRIRFNHIGHGLLARGGDLKWFQIAGEDRKFVDAVAMIDGDSVVVSAASVTSPQAVRYAWHRWPEGANFYNAEGLPAAPFRTDNWAGQ